MSKQQVAIFWFRRDLRLEDNVGLYYALKGEYPVLPIFIFDENILNDLKNKQDARVIFIHRQIENINIELKSKDTSLQVFFGKPKTICQQLLNEYDVKEVFANRDYEPYARERDKEIYELVKAKNIAFNTYKDQVIFEKSEITKSDGTPYAVFTPYKNAWKSKVKDEMLNSYPSAQVDNFYSIRWTKIISLQQIGFELTTIDLPSDIVKGHTLQNYAKQRDYPAKNGTSQLGIHLRFGTISIRKLMQLAKDISTVFFDELIWREFFQMILWHHPRVVNENYNKKYDAIPWRNNKAEFKRWCEGKTGYPIVDAGMRELNNTGFMHNRIRMVVASFLTKHLLIDWRWGEAYFAEKLLDYDLASNNGNWQWAAGTGVDAQPYFRVFNPYTQAKKFDPNNEYIKKWVPEYDSDEYVKLIVDHKEARERAIETYKKAVSG